MKINIDGLLGLNLEQIKIVFRRCRGDSVQKIANEMGIGASTIYDWMHDIFELLEVEDWRELEKELCVPLRRIIPSLDALDKGWPEAFREKIEALREPVEPRQPPPIPVPQPTISQSPTGSPPSAGGDGRDRIRRRIPPIWPLVAIPLLLACIVCGVFSWRIVIPIFQNALASAQATQIPQTIQETPATQAPTDIAAVPPTNTVLVPATQTSLPTSTITPVTPSPTPTETATPKPPALYETSFDSGMPDGMELVYGSVDFIDGQLVGQELTLLAVGDGSWKNYQVEYETKKNTYCWGVQENGVAAHAIDQDNMVLWSWNYCETGWFELVNGEWVKISGGRDIVANPGTVVLIRMVAEDRNFTVYTNNNKRSSYFNEKYTQGKVYILLSDESVIDNLRISQLP